jgi:hypothetical protein
VFDEEVNGQQGESEVQENERTTLRITALIVPLFVVHLEERKSCCRSQVEREGS